MLKFTRNKLATVYRKEETILSVHGILEDDIYGFEVDLDVDISKMEILSIRGKWNRMENSECPRAIPFLQEAVGFRMDGDFVRKVQKIVGRKACRHFAELILDCCRAVKDAAATIREEERQKAPQIVVSEFSGSPGDTKTNGPPTGQQETGGTLIDLHVHSFPASPCSTLSIEQIIEEARQSGLDGICLTDHNCLWDPGNVEELKQKHGFLILRGNEITTEQGDILVFGLEEDIRGVIQLSELREKVINCGGYMVAAHPFRGFMAFGIGYLGLTPEKAMERPVFKYVDAIEVLNSKVSEKENNFAGQVAEGLGLPVTGGSDAHVAGEVGMYATRFRGRIQNEKDFIKALREGSFTPVTLKSR